MLKRTEWSSSDGHVFLKCKTCKQEFYVVSAAYYAKTVNYCPYCGDRAHKMDSKSMEEEEDDWDV